MAGYDEYGNPIDEYGNIITTPARTSSTSHQPHRCKACKFRATHYRTDRTPYYWCTTLEKYVNLDDGKTCGHFVEW
jgi:hypothetical protein